METGEHSFILKSSKIEGIGVFALHDIEQGTSLDLFHNESRVVHSEEEVPEELRKYGFKVAEGFCIPSDFTCMDIGWFLNEDKANPNIYHEKYYYYAKRPIKKGEELVMDYSTL